jgi:Mg-chelatase subunit ChlD
MTTTKFSLRNFAGKPTRFFKVEESDLSNQAPVAKKSPAHHIFVLDRSGSMYGDMESVKSIVEKLLTLSEFDDASLRVSLITYSSQGDVKLHFKSVTVGEVMKAASPHLKEIRAIRATAMTCISQGLVLAETLIDDKETTCITLHTDGWANDRSPSEEARTIQAAVTKLKTHPGVFVNTIAYRDYCDYGLLSGISNQLSGACIQAKDIKQVYDALYGATALLAGSMAPALEAPLGQASYLTFVSKSAKKVLGSADGLVVRGLGAKDDRTVYRYYEVQESEYSKLAFPETVGSSSAPAVLAFARTQISEGRLNAAKYALVASKNEALLNDHYRALVSSDVAAFAGAIEETLWGGDYPLSANYGLAVTGPSVLRVLSVLDEHAKSLSVNLKFMLSGYKRRGIKRIPGVRLEDGTVQPPTVESRYRTANEEWISVNGFELNRNTATVNMLVSQPIDLYPHNGNVRVASVSGIDLTPLKSFNNYTLVGDGMLNVSQIMLKTSDKRCHKALKDLGAVTGEYTPNEAFSVDFSKMPLVDFDASFDTISPDEVRDLARLSVLSKIFSGATKGESLSMTSEQVAELKKHYLSSALYFSPPTTNEYADLQEAIAQGKVDTRLSYKIDVGIPALTSVSKLKSGNEYLQRRFTEDFMGKPVEKPTLDQLTVPNVKWDVKKLTARTQLDEVDNLSYPIYEGILGLGPTGEVERVLKLAGHEDPKAFLKAIKGSDHEEVVATFSDALRLVDKTIESFFDRVRPLAFYVGATGLVPDSLDAKSMAAEAFATQFPEAKLSKGEKEEGTFFTLPNGLVITVFVKAEHFTVTPSA